MRIFAAQKVSATAALLRKWNINETVENPSNINKIPSKLVHVRQYALDMAYVASQRTNETMSKQRSRIYGILKDIQSNTERSDVMRVVRKYPDVNYAATPPNQPQQCILTDYFNNYNFSKLK